MADPPPDDPAASGPGVRVLRVEVTAVADVADTRLMSTQNPFVCVKLMQGGEAVFRKNKASLTATSCGQQIPTPRSLSQPEARAS